MIANAAIFTCSICGEASSNICAYCTKDTCSNHRCERCKRCSDCCECEFPLSAEEAAPVEAATQSAPEPEIGSVEPEPSESEASATELPAPEVPAPEGGSGLPETADPFDATNLHELWQEPDELEP